MAQNRLAKEASPYLLQHAHNPVDWWPWSEEALAEAKRRDVPILLSIGYSACHWCHVMERESFDDPKIAAVMNERFVAIKVDREERPDLDQIYQLVVQLMGRSGGWPLTVFLTPSAAPFFAGTYFPPADRHGMPAFPRVLEALSDAWRDKRDEVREQAADLTKAIVSVSATKRAGTDADLSDVLKTAVAGLLERVDATHGGFGRAPKFPNTMPLEVLVRGDGEAREAARLALDGMRRGGIWDHLGGGFHRYSTDAGWLVPHFEKMLYDNALLLRAYVDAYRTFGEPEYADTARAIATYVTREMTDPEGGYYASQDADSEGHEGTFFVWDRDDIRAAAGADADAAIAYFDVDEEGNFDEHGQPTGKSVLSTPRPLAALGLEEAAVERARNAMFAAREKREKPFRDEKILASWNALMIGAMAEAGAALRDDAMVASAEKAFAFVEKHLVRGGRVGRLAKASNGAWQVKDKGFLDDHAYLANAALDLYEVTGKPAYASVASEIARVMREAFDDDGFRFTPKDGEPLIARPSDAYDHAVPSSVSMACRALLRLGALTGGDHATRAERELVRLATEAKENPFGYGQTIAEIDRVVRGSVDIVLVGDPEGSRKLARAVFAQWIPNRTMAWIDPSDPQTIAAAPAIAEGKPARTSAAAYVCRGRTCSAPMTTEDALTRALTGR